MDAFAPILMVLGIALPILTGSMLIVVGRWLPRVVTDALASVTAATVLVGLAVLTVAADAHTRVDWIGGWLPESGAGVGIALVADPVGAGLATLAAALVSAALVFSWRYIEADAAHFHALMMLFLAGLTGFALSGDLFDMLVFFELMGAVAYGLAGYKVEEPRALQGGLTFGVTNSIGAYFALSGIALLYARTGQLGLAQLGEALATHPPDALLLAGFALTGTGWLVKAAIVPFHFWLADAHAVAPSPVCVIFSGVMAELGLYAVSRVYLVVFHPALPESALRRAFLVLGVATAVVGSLLCLLQRNLKRMLAYSTIAHLGLFLLAVRAFESAGMGGVTVYVLGHAGTKGALFLLVGIMLARYGSVDEAELHGRGRADRRDGVLFGVAALCLAGLPPSGPGLGKAMSEEAVGGTWAPWLFMAVSAITGSAVLRTGLRVYAGTGRPARADDEQTTGEDEESETTGRLSRAPATMWLTVLALLVGGIAVGVLPGLPGAATAAGARFVDGPGYVSSVLDATRPATPGPPPAPVPHAHGWTLEGVALGLVSTALAIAGAFAMVWRPTDGGYRARLMTIAGRTVRPAVQVLERAHSGHIGDYVAWLLFGMAAFAALLALPP